MLATNTLLTTSFDYIEVNGEIPLDLPNEAYIVLNRETPLKIYSLGFQPAKTVPEIPRWFLRKYIQQGDNVLEPFAGSGTTIIESLRYRVNSYWLDYQPLSQLICRVKTTKFPLLKVAQEAAKVFNRACNQEHAPITVEFANKDFWFQKSVQAGLETLKYQITLCDQDIQPIFWLAFASTVRKASDMNDGMILAARRSHVAEIPKRSKEDVFKFFRDYVNKIIEALVEWEKETANTTAKAYELQPNDARYFRSDNKFEAVLTSPPYINAIDYVWASKFELHWLDMVKNDAERLSLYANEIGTERISKAECKELGRTGNAEIDQLVEDIYTAKYYKATEGQNQLRARVAYKYFLDMLHHFNTAHRHLKPGGYYCFAIGDVSKICGVDIPVAKLLRELAQEVGFKQIFQFHLLLKNRKLNVPRNVSWAGTIKHDTIVILQKN
jgi:hypothetical protein